MTRLSETKRGKIVGLRKDGYGYDSIAEKVGVSSKTAYKYGKGVKMENDRRYRGGESIKKAVKEEVRKLVDIEHIKPSHREKFDQVISTELDNAVKGFAQAFGLTSAPFVGLFGAGRSLANIAFDAEESGRYTVLPVVKNLLLGEQKLPVVPLRRKFFIRRIIQGVIMLKWDKIIERLKEEKT